MSTWAKADDVGCRIQNADFAKPNWFLVDHDRKNDLNKLQGPYFAPLVGDLSQLTKLIPTQTEKKHHNQQGKYCKYSQQFHS